MFKIGERNKRVMMNMKRDGGEVDITSRWFSETPTAAPYLNLLHQRNLPQTKVNALPSECSPSSNSNNGFYFSDYDSPYSAATFQDILRGLTTTADHNINEICLDSGSRGLCHFDEIIHNNNWVDNDVELSELFGRMHMGDEQVGGNKTIGFALDSNGQSISGNYLSAINPYNDVGTRGQYKDIRPFACGVSPGLADNMQWTSLGPINEYVVGNPMESCLSHDQSDALYSGSGWEGNPLINQICHLSDQSTEQGKRNCNVGADSQDPSTIRPYPTGANIRSYICGMESSGSRDLGNAMRFYQSRNPGVTLNLNPLGGCPSANPEAQANQTFDSNVVAGGPLAYRCGDGFTIQENNLKYAINKEGNSAGGRKSEIAIGVRPDKNSCQDDHTPSRDDHTPSLQICESEWGLNSEMALPLSLAELQMYIYFLAKDQNGCRMLQRMLDGRTIQYIQMIFQGILEHVIELMMDPFGNYLVQKLLDVCSEQQRMQILFVATKQPGQLVRISLDMHGTRVVQKLIETAKTKKQISLIKSSLQLGFLNLVKDLNGNHVIQRCLQCLCSEDNEFIFEAATRFCVDMATHQHGCCVLQRCVSYAKGRYLEKLVTEICRNGLLLAQDPFGNYVVQYIIEMQILDVGSKLISQFKGHYLNLSVQKFSSHVVEKCLKHLEESRSRIVQELLSASHFEQLLQDPYANYVIQSCLAVTKGHLHASLVEAVRPHKILRTSPYCKRIFSRNLLKK